MNKIKVFWISLISTSAIFLLWNINIDLFKKTPSPINPLRTPANVKATCLELVADFQDKSFSIPTESEVEKFFGELKSYGSSSWDFMHELENGYIIPSDPKLAIWGHSNKLKNTTVGQILLERRGQNESTAKILTELGYREQMGQLMPPRNLPKLYSKIYQRLLDAASKNGVSKDDIIFPAITFEKENELIFVRPGIDPLPPKGEGWKYTSPGELNQKQYIKMIQEKKMVLSSLMFFHDIGHIVDYIENPKYMVAYKNFQDKKMMVLEAIPEASLSALDYGPIAARGDMERYFNEWLYLPAVKKYEKIKAIIPHLDIENPKSFEEIEIFYINEKSKILSIAQKFVKEKYTLFANHGGGARDWSAVRYITSSEVSKGFEDILDNKSTYGKYAQLLDDKGDGNADAQFRMLEAPDLFLRLEYLIEFKKTNDGLLKSILPKLATSKEMSVEDLTDRLISLHLAQIEYRIQTALNLKINPEQVANDTAKLYKKDGWKEYKETATYAYYSTYPKYSVQWFLGVDVAKGIDP